MFNNGYWNMGKKSYDAPLLTFSRNNIISRITGGMVNMMQSDYNITPLYASKKHCTKLLVRMLAMP